jgi:alkylation response protein AidB-like acyl-CoA dehydrogenase
MLGSITDAIGLDADPIGDTEERRALRHEVARLVGQVAPLARRLELDEKEQFDDELHARLADMGVLALDAHEDQGGAGTALDQLVVLEELAAGPTSMAVFMVVHYMGVHILSKHGTEAQRERFLGPLIEGRAKFSFALTEAGGGTDITRAMKTTARRDGDGWVLNGQKTWISGAQIANFYVVLARTSPGDNSSVDGITMFLVPADIEGVRAKELSTVAVHGFDTNEVFFDNARVPEENVIGEVDKGFRLVIDTLNRERMNAAAGAIGAARGALAYAVEYAENRPAFGSTIGAFQAVQHRLVNSALAIESARSLLARAAAVYEAGGRADVLSSMAKVTASEAAVQATTTGMEVLGGAGFSLEYPMQQWFRDVRLWVFAPLNNDMVRNYLAERHLGLPRSF